MPHLPEISMTFRTLAVVLLTASLAAPAVARPGGMGGPGWGDSWDRGSAWDRSAGRARQPSGPAEGKVEVTRFVTDDPGAAEALGHGAVTVAANPSGGGIGDLELRVYEAAVADRLAGVGYQTATTVDSAGQIAELRVTHDTVVPEEAPHKPVSGEMSMGVSNRGSMMGMGLAIDLTKPKKALVGTRLEARIKDKASGKVLWEGRADVVTRDGDNRWDDAAIAAKLASALFERFPGASGETRTASR